MSGFAAGRLQTGGRATGLAQAALERTAEYADDRKQFGQPIGDYQLTQYKLGRMATHITAARAAHLRGGAARWTRTSRSPLEPAMAKLFACDVAVWVTQDGQLLHGGWGYAEEYPITRYVVDAHGAADLRGREADPRAEGHRAESAELARSGPSRDAYRRAGLDRVVKTAISSQDSAPLRLAYNRPGCQACLVRFDLR